MNNKKNRRLRVIILKPSKYGLDGKVERFSWGFMPNGTLPHIRSMTPDEFRGTSIEVYAVDEYVQTNLKYLSLLNKKKEDNVPTLVAIVGVQSHQFHRALDLAAIAYKSGCHAIIGGPHPMTCDTSMLHNRGISFALAEAELIWPTILNDAICGQLQPVYGQEQRWQQELESPVIIPPSKRELRRYVSPMLGIYPARGCPFLCNFCSVTKIAGRRIRSQSIGTTIDSLKAAEAAGIRLVVFVSDNFNKIPHVEELLTAMIEEKIDLRFFVQCDTQIAEQEELIALFSQAGCLEMFLGVESFNRQTLLGAKKSQNKPERYRNIVNLCRKYGIASHFSNILGFPQNTEDDIHQHLETLCNLSPHWASFYILCPIPGTEQYQEFLLNGWIFEKNLDRFDTSTPTWHHPHLSGDQLLELLYFSFKKFYSIKHIAEVARFVGLHDKDKISATIASLAHGGFQRYSAYRRIHPLSGGINRRKLDSVQDYLHLRREVFGFDIVPLPQNLQLSQSDESFNRKVNLRSQLLL